MLEMSSSTYSYEIPSSHVKIYECGVRHRTRDLCPQLPTPPSSGSEWNDILRVFETLISKSA